MRYLAKECICPGNSISTLINPFGAYCVFCLHLALHLVWQLPKSSNGKYNTHITRCKVYNPNKQSVATYCVNSFLPNDAIWRHELCELSISLWEFIWGFYFNTRRYTSVQAFCFFWLFLMGCKELRSKHLLFLCVYCRTQKACAKTCESPQQQIHKEKLKSAAFIDRPMITKLTIKYRKQLKEAEIMY